MERLPGRHVVRDAERDAVMHVERDMEKRTGRCAGRRVGMEGHCCLHENQVGLMLVTH